MKILKKIFLIAIFLISCNINFTKASDNNPYVNADYFNETQLKAIAQEIIASGKGSDRIQNHIIALHQNPDQANTRPSGQQVLSYFRLSNHTLPIYTDLINYVINHGTIVTGQENTPLKFSILCDIPINMLATFGAKNSSGGNASIGVWYKGAQQKYVTKVKVVFSVVNMRQNDYPKNSNANEIKQKMSLDNQHLTDKFPGDLITAFPIPKNFTH